MKNRFAKKTDRFSSQKSNSKPKMVFNKKSSAAKPAKAAPSGGKTSKNNGPLFPRDLRPIVGFHSIREAVSVRPQTLKMAWVQAGYESSKDLRELVELFHEAKIRFELRPENDLSRLCQTHQGAAVFSSARPELDWDTLRNKEKSRILVLDGIEDPHNLGAILRTSWLMGVDAVVTPQDRAVGLTATVSKVASGGCEHVPVVQVSNFTTLLEDLKKQGYWVLGLSHLGKSTVFDLTMPEKVAWIVGSEDRGMRAATERVCDELVGIPQTSLAASYNASVAAAIALSETFRQHSRK
jgi:23S rRNA (guanosine2251-2'-O)-methyltransferase